MLISKPSVCFDMPGNPTYQEALKRIEKEYRRCYMSESKGNDPEEFIKNKIKMGHESVLEHISFGIEFKMDRGISIEIVRHRHISPSQSSTRYCNYSKDKFGNEIEVIQPFFFDPLDPQVTALFAPEFIYGDSATLEKSTTMVVLNKFDIWFMSCQFTEWAYMTLLNMGAKPEEARSVLPNSLATSIGITANLREWRHILKLRYLGTTGKPHPQMREIMHPVFHFFKNEYPCFFFDLDCDPEPKSDSYLVETIVYDKEENNEE